MWWKYNRGIGMIISWADVIFGEGGNDTRKRHSIFQFHL